MSRHQLVVLLCLLHTAAAFGQKVAVRNNLLYDATLTPNLGLEYHLDTIWSVGVNGGLNAWDIDKAKNKKWRHLMISPFLRHYNTQNGFRSDTLRHRTFWGLHSVYSHYNAGNVSFPFGLYPDVKDSRLQGDLVSLGGSYGHSWRLTSHWLLEAELGLSLGYSWYDEYECPQCGAFLGRSNKLFLLPKLGLNIVWDKRRKPKAPVEPAAPVVTEVEEPEVPVMLAIHDVPDNTGRAGVLEHDNPVLEHVSKYRPYDRTRILRRDRGALYVHFPLAKSTLLHDFRSNAATLDRIVDITRQILSDSTSDVKRIQLIGLASIEGNVEANERLASNRAHALKDYLQQQVPTPDSLYDVVGGGEAWAEFRDQLTEQIDSGAAVAGITTDALREALAVVDSEPDADRREQRLRRLDGGRTWAYIEEHILADQRNSGYIHIYYDYVPDEAAAIINRANELLRTDCDDCYHEALELLRQVRDDERAQNALGVALYLCGHEHEALRHFRHAAAQGNADAQENVRQIERNMRKRKE